LPADQLVNATVIGLQVEPAYAWPLPRRGFDAAPPEAPRHADTESAPEPEAKTHDAHDDARTEEPAEPAPRSPCEGEAGDWCVPLSRTLREALRGKSVPRALEAAAEQWRLGRCVVLACPQGADPTGPAWAFVLWPKSTSRAVPLALFGLRVPARLQWTHVPPAFDWCHARVVKEQHPRHGRQLVAMDARGLAGVACEVQLGPVASSTPRWRDACVRIDAARRFWSALGEQWSVTVVVGTRALPGMAEATC
jgi:hypothetical protein